MATSRAAIRYAKALFETAQAKNVSEQMASDMQTINKAMNDSDELKQFLDNPVIKGEAKKNALDEIFSSLSADSKLLFGLLNNNSRFGLLQQIATKYIALFEESKGIARAYVTTAIPLTDDLKAKVLDKIKQLTSESQIEIINEVNPEIIGGFIIRIGDMQYNASVADKLNQLKRELINN
ncbi:MAG TPA: ATP synthase F1 subunit delta [Flavobacterium sp.]|nr:ATP synthase F1 subunit delta [Flavobacterium sp.]